MSVDPKDVPDTVGADVLAERHVAKEVAAQLILGKKPNTIAKEMNIKPYQLKKIIDSYHCKKAVLDLSDAAVSTAKAEIRVQASQMVKGIVDTLKHHLDNKNLNAIAPALKILGFNEEQKQETGPMQMTVILPSAEAPKTVSADYEEVNE